MDTRSTPGSVLRCRLITPITCVSRSTDCNNGSAPESHTSVHPIFRAQNISSILQAEMTAFCCGQVEYAVNDHIQRDLAGRRPFERLLRKLLSLPHRPVVMLIMTYHNDRCVMVYMSWRCNACRNCSSVQTVLVGMSVCLFRSYAVEVQDWSVTRALILLNPDPLYEWCALCT